MHAALGFDWNDRAVAELRHRWDAGESQSAIARRFGITKSAVNGKVHRLGLPSRPNPAKRRSDTPKPVASDDMPWRPIGGTSRVPSRIAYVPPKVGPSPVCCWPFGDPREPGFRFCCQPSIAGRSYCATHTAVAYVQTARQVAA